MQQYTQHALEAQPLLCFLSFLSTTSGYLGPAHQGAIVKCSLLDAKAETKADDRGLAILRRVLFQHIFNAVCHKLQQATRIGIKAVSRDWSLQRVLLLKPHK